MVIKLMIKLTSNPGPQSQLFVSGGFLSKNPLLQQANIQKQFLHG
jgi:hypothetical protein